MATTPGEAMIDSAPAEGAFEITPSDTERLVHVTRGLYVGITGDVHVKMLGGQTVTFIGLAAGVIHPLRVAQVFATDTTATEIIGVI